MAENVLGTREDKTNIAMPGATLMMTDADSRINRVDKKQNTVDVYVKEKIN